MAKISAIIPAFNEEERIGAVLSVLTTHPDISEVIVVDDGSRDKTSLTAQKFPVKVLRNKTNLGKGASLDRGVAEATGDILFFSDADISGLTHAIVSKILKPVLAGSHDMSIGILGRAVDNLPGGRLLLPVLGGERALTRELWNTIPSSFKNRFEIETALNFFSRFHGKGFTYEIFPELGHTIKETKHGLRGGAIRRASMITDVALAHARLYTLDLLKRFGRTKR